MCFSFADKKWDYRWSWGELYGQRLKLHALLQSLVQPNLDSNCAHRWSPCAFKFLSCKVSHVTQLIWNDDLSQKRNNSIKSLCHLSPFFFFLSMSLWVKSHEFVKKVFSLSHVTHFLTREFKSHGDHPIVVLVLCNSMIFIELQKSRKEMASSRQVFNNQHQNGTTVLHTGLAQLRHSNPINLTNL